MAQYRLSIKMYHDAISRRVDYINREGKYKYGAKGEEFVAGWSENLPSWAVNAHDFWQTIENSEKVGNVQARGFQLNLPIELNREEHIKIVQLLMKEYFSKHAYTLAFHDKPGNPHVHVLFSERLIDDRPEPGRNSYCKQRTGYSKDRKITGLKRDQWLRRLRKGWEEIQNQALERCGCKERVSCETLEKQGIKRLPQVHLGPVAAALERRGIKTRRGDINRRIRAINEKLANYEKEIANAYTEVDTCDLKISIENSKINLLEKENQTHKDSIWSYCNYFISDKTGIDDLCKRYDAKDFSGFVNLLAENFCTDQKNMQKSTKFAQEIALLESQNQMKLTDKEVSQCLTYRFWSLYGQGKRSWNDRYDSYIMYLQYRRALGKVLNIRHKEEKELTAYKRDLEKWDMNSKMFMQKGQNLFDNDVNLHDIIRKRLEETKKDIKEIKSDKDRIIKFEKNLELWEKQPLLTRSEITKHNEISDKIANQKDDIIETFNRLKTGSHDFYLEHESLMLNLDKKLESENNRVSDAIKTIEKAEEEQRLDKECVTTFEENLSLWEKQPIASRKEIEKHKTLSKTLSETKNNVVIAFNRLKVSSPEFALKHDRVLSVDKALEEDSKRVEDALNVIKQAERTEEEQRLKDEAERKAVQDRLNLVTEVAAKADKESAEHKKDRQKMNPVQEARQPEENQLEKGLVKQEPEPKIIEISMQSKPRCSIGAIYIFDHTISIAKVGQQLEDYKDSQIQELLDNYGLDIKEYSEQHPRKVPYLRQIVDMRDKYQQAHLAVTTDKTKSENAHNHQEQNMQKQSAERRGIENVWWGVRFRKDRPRVLFIKWANSTKSASYHADDLDRLFNNHCEDIKEYYAKSDNKKYDFDGFCKDLKHEIEIWKGPQPQNDLSISPKGRKIYDDGRGGR